MLDYGPPLSWILHGALEDNFVVVAKIGTQEPEMGNKLLYRVISAW